MKAMLKGLAKSLARPFWRMAAPVRRRLARNFEDRVRRVVEEVIRANPQAVEVRIEPPDLSRLEARLEAMLGDVSASVGMARTIAEHHGEEANLLMDGLVREVARLQLQLEGLAEMVEELRGGATLVVVGSEEEKLRVG
jgi:hypothetical protein